MNTSNELGKADLLQLLQQGKGRSARVWWGWGLALAALLIGAWWLFASSQTGKTGRYLTQPAALGDLVVRVSATGTLEPTRSVEVGSELSGTLEQVLVEENQPVTKGQLLAQLDISRLEDAVIKSGAALAVARAAVDMAQATLDEKSALLARLNRVRAVSGNLVSEEDLESAIAEDKRAHASLSSTQAQVTQAEANLKMDQTNLAKAAIRSPIDGLVLSRQVEPGQTLVSAMTIPILFTLAQDLTQMELQVQVDEADVSAVETGQEVSFTVAAWPGRNFPASIERVSLGSTLSDNVVTYKTVLRVHNPDLALRPGMTATASIVTARRQGVLLAPNDALRFSPPDPASQSNQEPSLLQR
ncbi:MAG: efflux RND transporter periplasmic adaptor subunit, partial [Gammaproteobacteria bacterium]|nr:efflux RND transporter periplasmic adaptor subunit [Gammaproteobacteria bacterium]